MLNFRDIPATTLVSVISSSGIRVSHIGLIQASREGRAPQPCLAARYWGTDKAGCAGAFLWQICQSWFAIVLEIFRGHALSDLAIFYSSNAG